ncbi:MAG: gamma-glutamyltransferase [Pseudomonadota bacterium]
MTKFAVAAGHDLTADAAATVLAEGGCAVDAAIAAAAMAMIAEPVLAGLLGGGFLIVREPGGQARLLDFFVHTPSRAVPPEDLDFQEKLVEFGTATQAFHIGAGTIAVPGVAPGLAEAHARYGRIPLPQLLAPACEAARKGVEVTGFQAKLSQIVSAILEASPSARALWMQDDKLPEAGAIATNPALADVLEVYGHEGPRFVTEGEVAQALLELARNGGQITAEDLKTYRPEWRAPIATQRGPARMHLNPPPALGGALVAFGLSACPNDPSAAQVTETLEATLTARLQADLDMDAQRGTQRLLDPELLATYRNQLARAPKSTRGTTHISIIDGEGMGAALTLSNGEGCGHVLPGTGIMPNNMLGEDDLLPAGMHSWTPSQRLGSMMCPMAVDWPDGGFAVLGSGGSNRIRSALVQVVIGLLDHGLPPEEAVSRARVHVDGEDPLSPTVDFEDLGSEQVREEILARWPEARPWSEPSMFFGGVHIARADGRGGFQAAGDPRRSGAVRVQ